MTVPLGAVGGPIAVETHRNRCEHRRLHRDDAATAGGFGQFDAAGRLSFKVTGQTGLPVIEATADLTFPVVWLNVATNVLPAGGWSFTNQITGSVHAQQFFRVNWNDRMRQHLSAHDQYGPDSGNVGNGSLTPSAEWPVPHAVTVRYSRGNFGSPSPISGRAISCRTPHATQVAR